ncbi:DNA repair ATPase [Pseudomonas sp. R1-18]|uniref:DNA repair ATPase n=1 Tax=Pseudomonas sp. R1-18 TaxID=1632772 RepID=UPI003DA87F25
MSNDPLETQPMDTDVTGGGAYEVLLKRLRNQGQRLSRQVDALNDQRLQEFGCSRMEVLGRVRVRTENNCVPRDIVRVGDFLLFGYNVFLGLRTETRVEDVLALFRLIEREDGFEAQAVPVEGTWLDDPGFRKDFAELYTYYRDARLLELVVDDSRLLVSFQVGERIDDIRVFRWSLGSGGTDVRYVDNRGERDMAPAAGYDFEWAPATREMIVGGRQPCISILDSVYVQLDSGELVLKIENGTACAEALYRHSLAETNQSLPDLQVAYARLGDLILLKVRPYKEEHFHYLVCNLPTRAITRVDSIGQACLQLPEDHGIVFPGGLYLRNGEHKTFESGMQRMQFKRLFRSPNGEDILYIFYEAQEGRSALFTYNMVRRQLQTPILGHGHACLEDGRMVIFSAEQEPARNHPMQIWQTPFHTEEYAARRSLSNTFLGRIGNADLVRGISDLYDLARDVETPNPTAAHFARLGQQVGRLLDKYHWMAHESLNSVTGLLRELGQTGGLIVDEFEKVEHLRAHAARQTIDAQQRHSALMKELHAGAPRGIEDIVALLEAITQLRGHLLTIKDGRYVDAATVEGLERQLKVESERISSEAAEFMCQPDALLPYSQRIAELDRHVQEATALFELDRALAGLGEMTAAVELLSGLASSLSVQDTAHRTRITEAMSHLYALMNQTTAHERTRRKALAMSESVAQFAAQFQLFVQSAAHALGQADTPEACDEQLSKLLIQLEDLESRFGGHEPFLDDLMRKREELLEAVEHHRQNLMDARQRQIRTVQDAAHRILTSLPGRTAACPDIERLNAFFATDHQVLRLRELSARLRGLDDGVKADDLDARLKAARDEAVRAKRDRNDLFDGGGTLLRLGPRHRFSVNTQPLELTLLPKGEHLWLHITGTDFHERIDDDAVVSMRPYFHASHESESEALYRGEYLAWQVLEAANAQGIDLQALDAGALEQHVRDFAAPRYKEGYEKGIHDHDAALVLRNLMPCMAAAGLLRFSPAARALALIAWHLPGSFETQVSRWPRQARAAFSVQRLFKHQEAVDDLREEIALALENYAAATGFSESPTVLAESAHYLTEALAGDRPSLEASGHARDIVSALDRRLETEGCADELRDVVQGLDGDLYGQWSVIRQWVTGACRDLQEAALTHYVPEATALVLLRMAGKPELPVNAAALKVQVHGLLGEHPRLRDGVLALTLDDFFARVMEHGQVFVPGLRGYQTFRQSIIQRERQALRVADFRSRPLTSFVRNKLINEVYLPLIADNLARQLGSAGEGRRSDLMGLLMLISPPGYGKTTLIEYIAFQLGMAFVKVNGPELNRGVTSLDPAQAPDSPARVELEKLNLALQLGSNVCLLIDDIQHLSPEFLQKFISLCDATRRIESVWKGQAKVCDLRGRKFCIVMAGNPYTESGEAFRIPDMLVNRADVHNLGEVTGANASAFALSYIENSLTSNPVLAPLANREISDLYHLVEHARGRTLGSNDLVHPYSPSEVNELSETLRRLMTVREVLLKVNAAYIDSASQAAQYRTEPPFRLQGSYRNMNRLAERISPVMNEAEIDQLITDHYRAESQLLTSGAEENLLKLAELRGQLNPEQAARWTRIKQEFQRNKALGGDETAVGNRIVAQLGDVVDGIRAIAERSGR